MQNEEIKSIDKEAARQWFIAFVGTRAEKAVRNRLLDLGIEAFAATQNEVRVRKNGRRVKIESVIITQYVFVHVTEEERKVIVQYPYIRSFLTDKASETDSCGKHKLAVIPDREMEALQSMLRQDEATVKFATAGFSIGDEVNMSGWPDNIKGRIIRIRGDQARYIGVRIEQLGCAYMEVSPSKLVKVD